MWRHLSRLNKMSGKLISKNMLQMFSWFCENPLYSRKFYWQMSLNSTKLINRWIVIVWNSNGIQFFKMKIKVNRLWKFLHQIKPRQKSTKKFNRNPFKMRLNFNITSQSYFLIYLVFLLNFNIWKLWTSEW